MNNEIEFVIRQAAPEDAPFILDSWRTSFKKGNPTLNKLCPNKIYSDWFKKRQISILENGASVLIACSSQDYSHILGYLVYQKQKPIIVHYIYIKQVYRNLGIATSLLSKTGISKEKDAILTTSLATKPILHIKGWNIIHLPDPSLYIV